MQIADVPTHKGCHTLDWALVRLNVICLSLTNVEEIDALGDHRTIFPHHIR